METVVAAAAAVVVVVDVAAAVDGGGDVDAVQRPELDDGIRARCARE